MSSIRINKYLASIDMASCRSIDEMVDEGRVKINEEVVTVGQQVDPEKDKISVDGKEVTGRERKKYILSSTNLRVTHQPPPK